jgi:MFS family permease
MSSLAPLAGRLSQIFSPRNCIFVSTLIFAFGTLWTSHAYTLPLFLAGRAITGVGAAGIMTLAVNLVIALTSKKTRGIFVGLINTGYTIGVSLGAVLAGALLGPMGWRALFWIQTPLAFAAGVCIFFSVPSTFTGGLVSIEKQTILQKLARIDYLGAVLLVSVHDSKFSFIQLLTGPRHPLLQPFS